MSEIAAIHPAIYDGKKNRYCGLNWLSTVKSLSLLSWFADNTAVITIDERQNQLL